MPIEPSSPDPAACAPSYPARAASASAPASRIRAARRRLGEAWLRAYGWSVAGGAPDVARAVVIAAPHTSNWDLAFMLAIAAVLDIDVRWIGKHTLFRPPFGPVMRALGGIGVDRRGRHNAVDAAIELIRSYEARGERLLLIVPPEGTRGRASRWKTGFYYIAKGAGVPIVLGFLDYGNKRGGLGDVFTPTGDLERDFAAIHAFYSDIRGKYPDRQGKVTLHADDAK